jgi:CRISPR-associated endonuclease/helicase Cas3
MKYKEIKKETKGMSNHNSNDSKNIPEDIGKTEWYGHSANNLGQWQTMRNHIDETLPDGSRVGVAAYAQNFATAFGMGERAYTMGVLHDLGKYAPRFQDRLQGMGSGLDHWSAGAWVALTKQKDPAMALAIQGHHIGLQKGDMVSLKGLKPETLATSHPLELKLTETDTDLLCTRLLEDGFSLPAASQAFPLRNTASAMLETRMLYSALVDADFLDTERHMTAGDDTRVSRPKTPLLQARRAQEILEAEIARLSQDGKIPQKIRDLRLSLANAVIEQSQTDAYLYTLTAPTGTGKTLAMLRFALARACRDTRIQRIIIVLPYLTLLNQTVGIYRKLFQEFGEHYILEHHSLTGIRTQETKESTQKEKDEQSNADKARRLLTENWDAPIIITTNVQFLESLFSSRSSGCRKLHNIAGSVVLFDEVQTLPLPLIVPTLKTLSRLACSEYACNVVFSTATQPAFPTLHAKVLEKNPQTEVLENLGWQPTELVGNTEELYKQARRVVADWSLARDPQPFDAIAEKITNDSQALCIVNLKRHAKELAEQLPKKGLFHLSTALCPAHRNMVLEKIREALETGQDCRLVATQCVEAGVDLDFPRAYRSMGPLEAIVQAAGRCNRSGKEGVIGQLFVFLPEDERYPSDTAYRQAAQLTKILLNEKGDLDINDPLLFQEYFRRLYDLGQLENKKNKDLENAIERQDYVEVAKLYRLIEQDTVNIVVPYDKYAETLMEEVRQYGVTRNWIRQVRPYTVSVYRDKNGNIPSFLETTFLYDYKKRTITQDRSNEWFLCGLERYYDKEFYGLVLDDSAVSGAFGLDLD